MVGLSLEGKTGIFDDHDTPVVVWATLDSEPQGSWNLKILLLKVV